MGSIKGEAVSTKKKTIVAITGATGVIYGVNLAQMLHSSGCEVHMVVSNWGAQTLSHEMGLTVENLKRFAFRVYNSKDMSAEISSGSYPIDNMVIAPCSMASLAAIATGVGTNLIHRAADVILKERKKLVLIPREAPLSQIHLKNMLDLTNMGVCIMPPVPAFYNHPKTVDDIVNHTLHRVLDQIGIQHPSAQRWDGKMKKMSEAPEQNM